jgi:5-methylcytosine-specific restriction enzyme subunit McrC
MLQVTVLERGRIVRGGADASTTEVGGTLQYRVLPAQLYDRLARSELLREERDGEGRVIDWRVRYGIVGQWVGVIQIPGLQLEILPKTDDSPQESGAAAADKHEDATRRNLLTMLAWGGLGTVRSRGLADLSLKRATIYDWLVDAFLDRALEELERGLDRQYAAEEGNLLVLRGKLVVAEQVTRNAAQRHRFYCRFDALTEATPILIRLRQCCRVLIERRLPESVLTKVRDVLGILDDVPDVVFRHGEPAPVFNRQNERFADIYSFASMVLEGHAADVRRGGVETFSLLFDMDKVFERFIAAFMHAQVIPKIAGAVVRPQGKGNRRPLFRDPGSRRAVLNLKPDLLVEHGGKTLVLDTKWKRLAEAKAARPTDADLYQLYAYLRRYESEMATLLYPARANVVRRDLEALRSKDDEKAGTIGVRFVDVSRELWTAKGRAELAKELDAIIRNGLGLPDASGNGASP